MGDSGAPYKSRAQQQAPPASTTIVITDASMRPHRHCFVTLTVRSSSLGRCARIQRACRTRRARRAAVASRKAVDERRMARTVSQRATSKARRVSSSSPLLGVVVVAHLYSARHCLLSTTTTDSKLLSSDATFLHQVGCSKASSSGRATHQALVDGHIRANCRRRTRRNNRQTGSRKLQVAASRDLQFATSTPPAGNGETAARCVSRQQRLLFGTCSASKATSDGVQSSTDANASEVAAAHHDHTCRVPFETRVGGCRSAPAS